MRISIVSISFIAILILALFFRFAQLNSSPPSLNWDEVSIGYNAYSILKTGKDEWGFSLPLSFRAYGDYKLPGYIYAVVPFVASLGLNPLAVKLPSALAGIGTVIFLYLITLHLTRRQALALLAMAIAAVSPWFIIFSRIALEANLALFLVTGGIYFFLKGLEKGHYLVYSASLFFIALFTYNSARVVFLPLLILAGLVFFKQLKKQRKSALISLAIIIAALLIIFPQAVLVDSAARFRWTTIVDEGAINEINEQRRVSSLNELSKKLVYNKVTYFIPRAITNYVAHFDPRFLYLQGGSQYQYSVPGVGLFFIGLLPFQLVGLYYCLKSGRRELLFIVGLLVIAPIPAAITRDAPHALRSLFLMVPLTLLAVVGLGFLAEKFKQSLRRVAVVLGLIVGGYCLFFWSVYTNEYTSNYSWSWQYGYPQAIEYVKEVSSQYDEIIFSKRYGEPHEFVLFYTQYDPQQYMTNPNLIRYPRSDWFWVDGFDKYTFINDWEVKEKLQTNLTEKKRLLIASPENYPSNATMVKSIYFLDGKKAFDIVEI